MTAEAGPILSAAPVTDLVMRARDGNQPAWGAIVERFAPLVWSIYSRCRRRRRRRRPGRLAAASRPHRPDPRPGRAARLASGHHQARMRPDRAASRLSTQFAY